MKKTLTERINNATAAVLADWAFGNGTSVNEEAGRMANMSEYPKVLVISDSGQSTLEAYARWDDPAAIMLAEKLLAEKRS